MFENSSNLLLSGNIAKNPLNALNLVYRVMFRVDIDNSI